jgi:alanine racemase
VEAFIAHRLTPVLNHRGDIEAWARAGRDQTRPLPGIVHIDTGMNRLGLEAGDIDTLSTDPTRLEGISLTYWMSHLACGAQPDHPLNERQRRAFDEALARLPAAKASLANSPGSLMGAAYHYDLLRPGIALYGGNPSPDGPRGYATSPMRPVVRAEAEIVQVRAGRPGESVGYSAAHVLARPTTIATVAVGYADGYLRAAGDRAPVALRGTRVPVIGRISMDLITVDVTDVPGVPVHVGERVELVGATIALSELSAAAGTIDYEILTGLGARYRRHYTIEAPAQPGEGSGGESDGESAGAPA